METCLAYCFKSLRSCQFCGGETAEGGESERERESGMIKQGERERVDAGGRVVWAKEKGIRLIDEEL